MDVQKTTDVFTQILLRASEIESLTEVCLESLIGPDDKKKKVFFKAKVLSPLGANRKAVLLQEYLAHHRPKFFKKHKTFFHKELLFVRELRNACGHGLISNLDDIKSDEGHIFSVTRKLSLTDPRPAPRRVTDADFERVVKARDKFWELVIHQILWDKDELEDAISDTSEGEGLTPEDE